MYPVITVPDNAADLVEPLGTKFKFWFRNGQSVACLFKQGRVGTGENWSEKVTSELCELLGIPHAQYDLAVWKHQRGVVSPSFVPHGGLLVHANELLTKVVPIYPTTQFYGVRQYTLRLLLRLLMVGQFQVPNGWTCFPGVSTGVDVFVGYLMLDAWIANQDRHHENVSFVLTAERSFHIAPTYDHASSLGRNETDENRRDRLTTRDKRRSIEHYVERAISALYASPTSTKPLTTFEAFKNAARTRPNAAKQWIQRLQGVSLQDTQSLFEMIPSDWITPTAIEFAQKMLDLNRTRILALGENL